MKNLGLTAVALLTLISLSLAAPKLHKNGKAKAFTGEIFDSQCAMNGSYVQMEKMHNMPDDTKACTLECVKMGGKFVLYHGAKKAAYQTRRPGKAEGTRRPEGKDNRDLQQQDGNPTCGAHRSGFVGHLPAQGF